MEKEILVYLAGAIRKGHETHGSYWEEEHLEQLREAFSPRTVLFLNPAHRTDDLSDMKSVFGRDMTHVLSADGVIADTRHKRGLGVGAEMMWAKVNGIPLISWAPLNTHYNRERTTLLGEEVLGYVHPFVDSLSDCVAETLEDAAQWLIEHLEGDGKEILDARYIQECMRHFYDTQFQRDEPMQELASSSEKLQNRLEAIQLQEL